VHGERIRDMCARNQASLEVGVCTANYDLLRDEAYHMSTAGGVEIRFLLSLSLKVATLSESFFSLPFDDDDL